MPLIDRIDLEPSDGEQGLSSPTEAKNDEKSITPVLMTPVGDLEEHNDICMHIFQKVSRQFNTEKAA